MTRKTLILFAAAGSAALLLAALGFQYFGGLAPCKMCIWQRWPHGAAILLALPALALSGRLWPLLGGLAALTTAGIGAYHTGVERGWWPGPDSCTGGGGLAGLSGADLLSTENVAPVVMCDEVVWDFLGLSMASWNMLVALALAALWLMAARQASSSASQ